MPSKKHQYLVDYTYQYEFAKIASENRVSHYSLVSSIGANEKSFSIQELRRFRRISEVSKF